MPGRGPDAIRSIKKTESALSGIFISYRRSDSPDATGRIYDRLVAEFGKARVFKDVDSIPLPRAFPHHLERKKAAEEYFKVTLEWGLDAGQSAMIRNTVLRS